MPREFRSFEVHDVEVATLYGNDGDDKLNSGPQYESYLTSARG